jgi:hypothetical protein
MRLTATRLVLLFLAMTVAMAWEPARRALRVDRCVDSGGSYDYALERCDVDRDHPYTGDVPASQAGLDWADVGRIMIAVGGLSAVFIWQDRRRVSRPVV